MASIPTVLKREATVQGLSLWFKSISGSDPVIRRLEDGSEIEFKPGQAKQIENYFGAKIPYNIFYLGAKRKEDKEEQTGESLNVSVPWGQVFIPLALKTLGPPLVLYSIALLTLARKF